MSDSYVGGHSIPYALTGSEIQQFLGSHSNIPQVLPPAGIVINDAYGQMLVWQDPNGVLHVIDVTNMAIAQHVNDATYESPDSSIVQNVVTEIENLIGRVATGAGWAIPFAVAFLVAYYFLGPSKREVN